VWSSMNKLMCEVGVVWVWFGCGLGVVCEQKI
jgi:hypothetical protein